MLSFLLDTANVPFTAALALMLAIGLMEGVGLLLGASLAAVLESLLPDMDVDGPDIAAAGMMSGLLGWLMVGRVPALILLVLLLLGFGVAGLGVQSVADSLLGGPLPWQAALAPALLLALPFVRAGGRLFARHLLREESFAVSEDEFVGAVATITLGVARAGQPAEARLSDRFGRTHYVRVEPELPQQSFTAGQPVVLVRRAGGIFAAVAAAPQTGGQM